MSSLHLTKSVIGKPCTGPVLLIIMDGMGIGEPFEGNAVHMANTPTLDHLITTPIYTQLKAHGTAVGMPSDDDMGNSEVGHNALGAGRIFDQGATLVQNAIASGQLFQDQPWKDVITNTNNHASTLHFIGLLSDGNVHSHINHLLKMLQKAAENGVQKARVHILLDGRDVYEKSAPDYIATLEATLTTLKNTYHVDYQIASGGGRMITTMDRYNADWDIVKRGWDAHVLGEGRPFHSATEAISTYYQEDPKRNDQYLPPFVIVDDKGPIGQIQDNDSVIFCNFRGDRAIEITQAFEVKDFTKFDRKRHPKVHFAGMMQYDGDLKLPNHFLVQPPHISHPISDYLCAMGIRSFAISETQKYGHVTYFWNGNNSGYINQSLETYVEIPSDRIPFEQKPEMKAYESTQKTIELLKSGQFDFGRINIANPDMVGHTGVMDAAVKSVEVTDDCVTQLLQTIEELNGCAIILADHGNADIMFEIKNGQKIPKTSHTLNPVPCAIIGKDLDKKFKLTPLTTPGLTNIAATLCTLLGYEKPTDYDPSLLTQL